MVDYDEINEAMERTRLEVRRMIMEEGAATERAEIVAFGRRCAQAWRKGRYDSNTSDDANTLDYFLNAIERGEYKQPKPVAGELK